MTKDATSPLGELIAARARNGMTRERIALLAGCSRVQLWRLERGIVEEDTRVGRNVRRILSEPKLLRTELIAAVDACVGADDKRARMMLHLLHLISDLVGSPDRA